jgi:predicted RND superfamily exporter protein
LTEFSDNTRITEFVARLSRTFGSLAGWSFDHRWWVVLFSIAFVTGSLALASNVRIDSSFASYFDPMDPTYRSYETFREDFGSDEISYILYEAPGAEFGPWNIEIMRKIVDLTEVLEDEVPFAYEVLSIANAELMVGNDDGVEIRQLRDVFPESQEGLLQLRSSYLEKPMMVGGILSADAQFGAIVIEMDLSSTDPLEDIRLDPEGGDGLGNLYPQATSRSITEILARPEYSDIQFYHSGDVPLNAFYNEIVGEESAFLNSVTVLVIAAILLFFFRSIPGALAPILVVQMSVISTVAFIVLVGWQLDLSFGSVPTLLTTIGVAHSVHILSEFRRSFLRLGDRREALVQTMHLVGVPCLLTSLTTAMGFIAMSSVPIVSIAHMGVYSAFSCLIAFLLSITVLSALLSFGRRTRTAHMAETTRSTHKSTSPTSASPTGQSSVEELSDRFLRSVHDFVVRARRPILITSLAIFLASAIGITQLVAESNWFNDFSDSVPVKADTLRIDETMGGLSNLILIFDVGESGSIIEPAAMREIDRIQAWANQEDLVRKSYSITDIIKDLNQTFHGNDPDYYTIPESRELIAQYLILYESAGGDEAFELLSSDYQRAQLELRLGMSSTAEVVLLKDRIENELALHPLTESTLEVTGVAALWLKLINLIVTSQAQGFLVAFVTIAALMCALLGSVKTGLICMVPNLVPVFLTLGAMGWLEIPLDYSKVFIAAVAMGIAVDDTIHLVLRFRHEFSLCGQYSKALRAALVDVGRALVITSIALIAGFQVLQLSAMDSSATQGILLSTTILAALIADFLLMPALILTFKPFGPERAAAEG